jgi:hypothetical protein
MSRANLSVVFVIGGGAFTISAAQSAFNNQLLGAIAKNLPDVSPARVLTTGATAIRDAFSPEQVPIVVDAYMTGLRAVFAIAVGAFGIATLVGFLGSWKRLHSEQLKEVAGGGA